MDTTSDARVDATPETQPVAHSRARRRVATRWLVAFGVAAGLCAWLWIRRPDHLVQSDDIIGYPSFSNFDFQPLFLRHRLLMWLLPLTTAVVYVLLRRWGPLSEVTSGRGLEEPDRDDRRPTTDHAQRPEPAVPGPWSLRLRVVPPAALLAVAGTSTGTSLTQDISWQGLAAGVGYVALVAAITLVLIRRGVGAQTLTRVNAVGAAVTSVVAVYLFSLGTATVDAAGEVRRWAWLPLWVAIPAVLVVAIVVLRKLARRPPLEVERHVLTVFTGAAAVFLLTASMPGGVGTIIGFDGSHSVVGADLLTRGYFPWRDYLAMHGLFDDALRTSVGFALFEHSYWGEHAALMLLWSPLFMVGLYLLLVWAAPRAWMVHVAAVLASPLVMTAVPVSHRWVGLGYVLILLGVALQRRTTTAVVALTSVLFVLAVLVPEHSFQVIAIAAVLVAADLVGSKGTPLLSRFRTTRVFVGTGVVLLAGLVGFLALHGAVGDWVDYYLVFGPGHNESGALSPDDTNVGGWEAVFFVNEWLTGLTIAGLCVWLVSRRPVTARGGVLGAAAITIGLYAEKALGRFDAPHVAQVISVALPLWILLVVVVGAAVNPWLVERFERREVVLGVRFVAVASLLTLLAAFLVPLNDGIGGSLRRVGGVSDNNKAVVSSQSSRAPLIGYLGSPGTDLTMVSDLRTLLDTLTPPGELVYDFTNSPGYFTYLLQEDLSSRFYTVGVALAEDAQDEVVEDLRANPPAVVVFDALYYGLPAWDGPRNSVRHFEISQYLLDGWTPVASTYGFLFMMRNDLLDSVPAMPTLHQTVRTEDLYESMPDCEWGYAAHYLRSDPVGEQLELPVRMESAFRAQMVGWAYDPVADAPVSQVLVASGDRVVDHLETGGSRPDVAEALGLPGAASSGFAGSLVFTGDHEEGVRLYAVAADGKAYPLNPPTELPERLRDGSRSFQVGTSEAQFGWADGIEGGPIDVGVADVPAGVNLPDYELATFEADGPLGVSHVSLSARLGGTPGAGINGRVTFGTLPRDGDDISVRVGSCLQWHGFDTRHLYLTQIDGRTIDRITLSGVKD